MVTRRPREELRQLVLDAAVELLHQSALTITVDALSYQSVFNHLAETKGVKVTHASVHERIWASQRDFQVEALEAAIQQVPSGNHEHFAKAATEALASLPHDSEHDRNYAMREITRLAMNTNWTNAAGGNELLRVLRLLCVLESPPGDGDLDPDADTNPDPVLALVGKARRDTTELYKTLIRQLGESVGVNLRPNLGMDIDEAVEFLATSANATITGMEIDQAVLGHKMKQLPTGLNGELQDWYPIALATWALVAFIFDIDISQFNVN